MNANTKGGLKKATGQGRFKLLTSTAMVAMALTSMSALAGSGGVTLSNGKTIGTYYANSPKLRKFVDTLPGLTAGNANAFASGEKGEYIPIAEADTTSYPGSEYFIIGVVEHAQKMHSDLIKPTTLRSYVQLYPQGTPVASLPSKAVPLFYPDGKTKITWPGTNEQVYGYDKPHYLGPIILTTTGTPVRTTMVNLLPTGRATVDGSGKVIARNGDMFLPVDETLGGAGLTTAGDKYPQNRAAFHLHGGDSPWISDGTPHQWITPAADLAISKDFKTGNRMMNVPDMPFPGQGSQNIFWPNDQSARLMWYHDHTFGLTRQNAYGGEAAGYVIMDAAETALLTGNGDFGISTQAIPNKLLDQILLVIQDKTFVPDDIAVQDSKWDQKAWGTPGDLWYPHVYEPFQIWDANALGSASYYTSTTTTTTTTTTTITVSDSTGTTVTGPTDVVTTSAISSTSSATSAPAGSTGSLPPTTTTSTTDSAGVKTTTDTTVAVTTVTTVAPATPADAVLAQQASAVSNPAGRWDYAVNDLTGAYLPPSVGARFNNPEYGPVAFPDGSYADGTAGKGPSATPESYMDTPVINGVAYPVLNVEPKAYRVRFLNGANDRYFNISLWKAAKSAALVDPFSGKTTAADTEVTLIPPGGKFADGTVNKSNDPAGVPDPATAGPSIIQFGNESGFLPKPVVHAPKLMNFNEFGEEIADDYFYLGSAERADTVIDFSQFAGQTLIMYNDGTAPVPGGDARYDYYTGNPDQTPFGGAPSTQAGYGPNTRTLMQIRVAASKPAPAYDPNGTGGAMVNELPKAYAATADLHIVSVAPVASDIDVVASTIAINNKAEPLQIKTIHGFTDPNIGRLIAQLGTELPIAGASVPTPLSYIDLPTEILKAGETQYWWIKNYDVDNHPMHFHLFNVQVLAHRNQIDGSLRTPVQDEMGWKETVKNWPGEDLIVAVRPKTPALPFGLPNSVRKLDPTLPVNATANEVLYGTSAATAAVPFAFAQLDLDANSPNYGQPMPVSNTVKDFGWEYVWHCHILGHEENDLMRPMVYWPTVNLPTAPGNLAVNASGSLTWTDATPALAPATKGNVANEIGFSVKRVALNDGQPVAAGLTLLAPTSPVVDTRVSTLANATSYQDTPAPFTDYTYKVSAVNEGGSAGSVVTLMQAPAAPTGLKVTPGAGLPSNVLPVTLNWTDVATNEDGYVISGAATGTTAKNVASFTSTNLGPVVAGTKLSFSVAATKLAFPDSAAASATLTVVPVLAAPTALQAVTNAVAKTALLTWVDQSFAETGYVVNRAAVTINVKTGIPTPGVFAARPTATTVLSTNAATVTDTALAANTLYQYQVTPRNGLAVGPMVTLYATTATTMAAPSQVQSGGASTVSSVSIAWQNTTSTLATGYEVQSCLGTATACKLAAAVWTAAPGTIVVGASTSKFVASGLLTKTQYSFRIRAVNKLVPAAADGSPSLFSTWTAPLAAKTL